MDDQRQALGPDCTNRRKVVESPVENGEARWTVLTCFGLAPKSDAKGSKPRAVEAGDSFFS